jgi:hypothetical protein
MLDAPWRRPATERHSDWHSDRQAADRRAMTAIGGAAAVLVFCWVGWRRLLRNRLVMAGRRFGVSRLRRRPLMRGRVRHARLRKSQMRRQEHHQDLQQAFHIDQ